MTELPSPYFQILICNVIKEQKYLKLNCPINDRNHQGKKPALHSFLFFGVNLPGLKKGSHIGCRPQEGNCSCGLMLLKKPTLALKLTPYPFPSQMPSRHKDPVVQLLSHVRLFVTQWTAACQASVSFTVSWSLLKLMSIESVMPSSHLILSPPSPSAFKLSQHQSLFQ